MTSMMGNRRTHSALEFLTSPDKAKAAIKAHNEAARKHAAAADYHQKCKAEAQKALEELTQRQISHDQRELFLKQSELRLDQANDELKLQIIAYTNMKDQAEQLAERLCIQIQENTEQAGKTRATLLDREKSLDEVRNNLFMRDEEVTRKEAALAGRERLVIEREDAIVALANRLRA